MNKLQKEAIAHYNRMIRWAKKQPQNEHPDDIQMYAEIKEDWSGDCCPYCLSYDWDDCPLKYEGCCNGLWDMMAMSRTWKTWIKYAEKIKQYIKDNG